MANNINWQPQRFQTTNFNPNAGLALAAQSGRNITESISDEEKAASLADFRQQSLAAANRRQDFVEAEPERAIAEEQRLLRNSAEQGTIANEVANAAGLSRAGKFFEDPRNRAVIEADPRYQAIAGKGEQAVADFRDQFVNDPNNRRLLSDSKVYRNTVLTKLLESGRFNNTDANTIADQKTSQLFPTLDPAIAGKLLQKQGTSASSTGVGRGSGTFKNEFNIGNPKDRADVVDNIVRQRGLEAAPDNFLWTDKRWEIGRLDPTGTDIASVMARLAQDGVVSSTAAEASVSGAFNADGNTLEKNRNFTTKEGYKKVLEDAKAAQTEELRKTNTKSGSQANQIFNRNAIDSSNQRVLDKLNPDQSTREKRLAAFMSGLPGVSKAKAKKAAKEINENIIDVDGKKPPAKTAAASKRILPPKEKVNGLDDLLYRGNQLSPELNNLIYPGAVTKRSERVPKVIKRILSNLGN